ncbi:hypothetical protein BIW11_05132, partial [Tropilaelaps mercedesae]
PPARPRPNYEPPAPNSPPTPLVPRPPSPPPAPRPPSPPPAPRLPLPPAAPRPPPPPAPRPQPTPIPTVPPRRPINNYQPPAPQPVSVPAPPVPQRRPQLQPTIPPTQPQPNYDPAPQPAPAPRPQPLPTVAPQRPQPNYEPALRPAPAPVPVPTIPPRRPQPNYEPPRPAPRPAPIAASHLPQSQNQPEEAIRRVPFEPTRAPRPVSGPALAPAPALRPRPVPSPRPRPTPAPAPTPRRVRPGYKPGEQVSPPQPEYLPQDEQAPGRLPAPLPYPIPATGISTRERSVMGPPFTRRPRPRTTIASDISSFVADVDDKISSTEELTLTRRRRRRRPTTTVPTVTLKSSEPPVTESTIVQKSNRTEPALGIAVKVTRLDRSLFDGSVPPCKVKGRNFCVLTNDYPMDVVSRVVDENIHKVKVLYKELHTVADPALFHQHRENPEAGRGDFACDTEVEELQVGWAREAVSKEWMLVVNTDYFPQMVHVEKCMHPRAPCKAIDALFESTCQQRFSLHRLIAFRPSDPESSPVVSLFKFPAGCSCRIARRGSRLSRKTT